MKTIAPNQATPSPDVSIRILKITSCPSLSGQSTLTYHVGCTASSEIQSSSDLVFRVFGNSGGGYFSNEWIGLNAIDRVFAKVPNGIAITAHVLTSLFQGKSANSTGFLFAVLKNEGLVRPMKDKKGSYERSDGIAFMADVKQLIDSAVDLKVEEEQSKGEPVKSTKAVPVPSPQQKSETKRSPVAPKPANNKAEKRPGPRGGE